MDKRIFTLGIALNRSWFFSPQFGKTIGITEAEPEIVIKKARELTNTLIDGFLSEFHDTKTEIRGLIQFGGESIMLYQDPEMIELISSLTSDYSDGLRPVYPYIHIQNDAWPEKDYSLQVIDENLNRTKIFHGNAVVIHLNADNADKTPDIMNQTLDALLDKKFIEMIQKYRIHLCFENNHHLSFFGFPENIIKLYHMLDKRLFAQGLEDIMPYYSFCFDLGHFITQLHRSNRNIEKEFVNFYEKFANRIGTFHIHTNSGAWDHHLLPIDYKELLIADKTEKYDPVLTDKHTEIIWRSFAKWRDAISNSLSPRWFIFELDIPYTPEQIYELGKRLGESLNKTH